MNKILKGTLLAVALFLVVVIVLAIQPVSAQTQSLGTFRLNQTVNLIQTCLNSTYSNLTRVTYPDSTFALNGEFAMTKSGDNYNYPFNLTGQVGQYLVYGHCDENNIPTSWNYNFFISQSGGQPASDFLIVFIYVLFIIGTIGLFMTLILTIVRLATATETVYSVLVSWGFYLLIVLVNFLAKEYLFGTFVENMTGNFLTVCAYSNVVLPLISLVITIFIKATSKKKNLSVKELTGKRLFQYG